MSSPSHPLTPTRRVGQVISVSPTPTPTVEVAIGADPSVTVFAPYLDSYQPIVNDYVVLLGTLGDYLVLGTIATGTRKTYTPTWTVSAGTAPSVGNGSLNGWWEMVGPSRVHFDIQLTIGSTTTGGSVAGFYTFSLPLQSSSAREQDVLLKIHAQTGGNNYGGWVSIAVSATTCTGWYQTNAASMTQFGFAAPVLGTGGLIVMSGVYEVA